MDTLAHEVAERGVDFSLALDADLPSEGGAFDDQGEMAFAAAVVAGVADMRCALVLQIEAGGGKRRR